MSPEPKKTIMYYVHKWHLLWILPAVVIGFLIGVFAINTQGKLTVEMISNDDLQKVDRPIVLKLSQHLADVSIETEPHIEGSLQTHKHLFGIKRVEFKPNKPFLADTEYKIKITNAKRVLFGSAESNQITFRTEKAPELVGKLFGGQKTIAMDQKLSASLNSRAGDLRDIQLISDPKLKLERISYDDINFTWKYKGYLKSGTKYTFIIKDKVQGKVLEKTTVTTAKMPSLKHSIPVYGISPSDQLKIVFGQSIDRQKSPKIKFSLPGSGKWQNDKEYVFTPKKLEPAKEYKYYLPKGLRTKQGGILDKQKLYSFNTNGHIRVVGMTPTGRSVKRGTNQVRITFNQLVDHASAQKRFHISNGKLKGFSWQGRTMIAHISGLGFQQTTNVRVDAGVKPVFGLAMNQRFSYKFTTEARVVKLKVPYYRQVFPQSCEASSLRMALAYRGIKDSDWNILQKFGYHPRPRDKENNEWDDPNQQFVGDVRGSQGKGTGWGVYAGPVSRAAGSYGRSTSIAYGANANFVAREIHRGNPVIAWGIWGSRAKIDSWNTPDGRTIRGPIPMHVRLIVGVKGEPHAPLGFYVHDPITGVQYWTKGQFINNTAAAGPAAQLLSIR
ncbi:hypothetical protein CR969_02210 [Candidatus Saccharibacteria bacterium]|nr:MAG: hypothetical protein CR969_02210 [Candidatus Saccharibacteria bacterium]